MAYLIVFNYHGINIIVAHFIVKKALILNKDR